MLLFDAKMVDVAQLVRAPVCGTGGCGFESHLPPHLLFLLAEKILSKGFTKL